MVKFNPDVPDMPDPNYLGYSKQVSPTSADTSTGKFLSTVGEDITLAANAADSSVKGYLRDKVAEGVDPLRDAYTSSLEAMRYGNKQSTIPDPHDQIGPVNERPGEQNLMLGRNNEIPSALQNGVDKATAIAEAQNQGVGHQNDTAYAGALTALTKQLRAQWPGYRDYIDQEVSKVSGIPIANAYIKNMLEDINRTSTQAKTENEKTLSEIRQNMGFPKGPEMYEQFQRTGDVNAVNQWLNYNKGIINTLALKKSAMEAESADKTAATAKAMEYGQTVVNSIATEGYNNARFAQGDKSAAEISTALINNQGSPGVMNDQAVAMAGQKFEAYRAQATTKAMAILTAPGPDGKTPADRMGGIPVARKLVDENIGALFDSTSKLIYSKDFGMANTNQRLAAASVDDKKMEIVYNGGPNGIGDRARTIAALTSLAPNYAPFFLSNNMKDGLQGDIKNFSDIQRQNAIMQPNLEKNGGLPYTLGQSVDELTRWGNTAKVPAPGGAFKSVVDVTDAITNPKAPPEVKLNALTYFFDPANKGAMGKFQDDYYDSKAQRMVPGRTTVFAQIVSPGVIAEAKKMADNGNPLPLKQMTEWAQSEAATNILRNQIGDLNTAIKDNPYHIFWNNENHSFTIENHDGTPLTGLHSSFLNQPYRTVQNVNSVMGNLANLAKVQNINVDAFLFKTLRDGGMDTSQPMLGVAVPMMRAMQEAAGGRPANSPDVPVSRFADEKQPTGPTVKEFVSNPTGKTLNLSEGAITGIQVDNIPEGMSAKDFIKELQKRKK